ncbi:MAG: signal peptide peptidase SppA, partial [SAR324 cluster bacterium]|nr:signal peptide peptidase SppA [SAR324 cluster bacterium]
REYFIWLAKLITIFVIIFIIVPVVIGVSGLVIGLFVSDGLPSVGKSVAVVELSGEIYDSKSVIKELYKQAENKKVKGTVLRINSPGGAVGPSQEIYQAVRALNARNQKKPVVVSLGAVAASGGLYAALGGAKIYAQPGTLTGSIGVIMQLPNLRKLTDFAGVDFVTIKSGELKDVGNMFREMTENEKQFLQETIQRVHQEFVRDVSEGRKIPIEKVQQFADGRIILGEKAKELGLIDDFGSVYDAASAVCELAGEALQAGELPHLYYPREKFAELRNALESISNIRLLFTNNVQFKYLMY